MKQVQVKDILVGVNCWDRGSGDTDAVEVVLSMRPTATYAIEACTLPYLMRDDGFWFDYRDKPKS